MFCPKCGNEISMFADKCLSCGENFKNLSLAQRQELERNCKPSHSKRIPRPKRTPKPKVSRNKVTEVRIEYNNGIACKEGMSRKGTKLKKGSFKKRPNNEGIGFRLPHYGIGEY